MAGLLQEKMVVDGRDFYFEKFTTFPAETGNPIKQVGYSCLTFQENRQECLFNQILLMIVIVR